MALKRKTALGNFSAYHGGSWSPRRLSHEEEYEKAEYWPAKGVDSEYAPLRELLLYETPERPPAIRDPEKVQFLAPVDWKKLRRETRRLKSAFEKNGVRVRLLRSGAFPSPLPNLLFVRDHFFLTPYGAVLGRMASSVRAGEEKWAQLSLAEAGIPILHAIRGNGTFEGADALWIRPDLVLVGVGNRTNASGYRQLKNLLADFGISCISVKLPKKVQHLLGLLQIVAPRSALLRASIADPKVLRILKRHSYKILEIGETDEVTRRQGMNIVALAPNRVIMASGCPELKAAFRKFGIRIAAEVPITQYIHAAGGIACAGGILSRTLTSRRSKRSSRRR